VRAHTRNQPQEPLREDRAVQDLVDALADHLDRKDS